MIRRILFLIALAAAAAPASAQDFPPQPPVGSPPAFAVPASESFRLPNGMQVTLIPYGNVPKAMVSLRIGAGAINEGKDTGLAGLTAQLMREGAGGRTAAQIAGAAAAMGGNLMIGAGEHETMMSLNVLSEHADEAVALLSDIARRPDFPASELERIRNNLLRNVAVAKSQPQAAAEAALAAAYYGADHPYGRLLPSESQLRGYTLEDVRRFHAGNFGGARSRLYIAGRFDTDAVRRTVEAAFANWAAGPAPISLPPQPRPGPRIILVEREGAPQSTIRLAFPAPVAGSANDIPFRVTNALLGGSFTSRITTNIREEKGYTYSPSSDVSHNPDEAIWGFEADVTTADTGKALHEVFKEIRTLQQAAPGEEEAGGMRTWMAGTFVLQNASPGGLIASLAERDFHGLPGNWLDAYVPTVLGVSAAQMQALAGETLPLDRMTLVVVGDLDSVEPQLRRMPELKGIPFQRVDPFSGD